jgi:uncharacterized membrane protein
MKSQPTNIAAEILGAAGIGAALMYFLDPDRGARRRALVRDKVVHAAHVTGDSASATRRDIANRTRGVIARVLPDRSTDYSSGDNLVEGHADDRYADEETTPQNRELDILQDHWSPATRALSGAAGGILALYGAQRRDGLGAALGLAGLALLARGASNRDVSELVGLRGGRRVIDVQKTVNIDAPRAAVFAYLTAWEKFPEWMSHVREVRVSEGSVEGMWTHWVVDGPAGTTVSWDAEVTRFVPNELVAWTSVEGAAIRQAGKIRFSENEDGSTRVHIQMSYNPPGGAAGHAVATLFGRDPKQQMDDDLARLTSVIETGHAPRDAAKPAEVNEWDDR